MEIKFISSNETIYMRELLAADPTVWKVKMSLEECDQFVSRAATNIENGTLLVPVIFDNNRPIAMYLAKLFPYVKTWVAGLTKVTFESNHFIKTAKVLAPALDALIYKLEGMGYYKFYMVSPEHHHNIRNQIITKFSPAIDRYCWVDEDVIPRGELSSIPLIANYMSRRRCEWTDLVVRLFILKQEERVALLTQKCKYTDYKGTLIDQRNLPISVL